MEIYLLRHTAVNNPHKLCYGQSEIDLATDWANHFTALKQKMGPSLRGALFYSSPYQRCKQLAGFLSDDQFQIDSRLSEMHFGDWEQCLWTDIDQPVLNAWMADFANYQVPGGESFVQMHGRCTQFWDELLALPSDRIVVVTHAGVIRSLLAYILSIPLEKTFQLEVEYSSVTKITVAKQQGCYQTVNYINR
ncbi:alpha-ribazole phosphatase [Mucilaginibacter sp. BT774]|uniref:alpha-ribazole phosphatase n=1 Tax=Mucilaginibacter sp. BT774 TaxID=3062276 RepID=UPI0026761EFE|nr:alpha-ribazole phosphatase [Mucilaginibacter sp. BT774]MDO3625351.1 alpha-ribazole phosphatase [Mucilaginibacter sp. BT774]